jgi:hypothetical protein
MRGWRECGCGWQQLWRREFAAGGIEIKAATERVDDTEPRSWDAVSSNHAPSECASLCSTSRPASIPIKIVCVRFLSCRVSPALDPRAFMDPPWLLAKTIRPLSTKFLAFVLVTKIRAP